MQAGGGLLLDRPLVGGDDILLLDFELVQIHALLLAVSCLRAPSIHAFPTSPGATAIHKSSHPNVPGEAKTVSGIQRLSFAFVTDPPNPVRPHRFTDDTFAGLISTIFIYEALVSDPRSARSSPTWPAVENNQCRLFHPRPRIRVPPK